jgi:hypothetical protein
MKNILAAIGKILPAMRFRESGKYWEERYRLGGHSGEGSRGINAEYKAEVMNRFIGEHQVESLIEFGCGDGHQLAMFNAPRYLGVDVSRTVIQQCQSRFAGDARKSFVHADDYAGEKAELALSLDVIFHLVEDEIYKAYLERLFAAAERYVVIYSTSADIKDTGVPHVRHRDVITDVARLFPAFERMPEDEAQTPSPVRFDRGLATSFFMYRRRAEIRTAG